MYKASIKNQDYQVDFQEKYTKGSLNGENFDLDIVKVSETELHIIKDFKSYKAELLSKDDDKKELSLRINGEVYEVALKDKYDLLLDKLGIDLSATKKVNELKAPMPGLVFRLDVKVGDEVEEGQGLLILEAMKMENMIKSPTNGVISAIHVKEGVAVEKNEILINFE